MSEIKNGTLGLYGAEHSKCNRMVTLGFKGLTTSSIHVQQTTLDTGRVCARAKNIVYIPSSSRQYASRLLITNSLSDPVATWTTCRPTTILQHNVSHIRNISLQRTKPVKQTQLNS